MKIFFIVPLLTHYRETFYQKLIASNPQHNWLIIDGEKKVEDGRPNYYKQFSFPHCRFTESIKKAGPYSLRDYTGLYEFVKVEKPDVVIVPGIVGTKAYRKIVRLPISKIMWSCLWEHPDVKNNFLRDVKNIVLKKYLKSANYQITYSSYAKKRLLEVGFPEEKIFIAYNGIDTDDMEFSRIDAIKRDKIREVLSVEKNKKIFLYVGGLGEDKNVKLLLQATQLLKTINDKLPFIIFIIGDGPQGEILKAFVKQNGLDEQVKFLGRIVKGVDEYFQCCDCLILPGAGGLSLNQAMYWNKTCIVSHADGTEEDLVKEGTTGFRFEPDNAESLKQAMIRFLNTDADKLSKMGKEGNKLVLTQSNVDKMVETFTKVINRIELVSAN